MNTLDPTDPRVKAAAAQVVGEFPRIRAGLLTWHLSALRPSEMGAWKCCGGFITPTSSSQLQMSTLSFSLVASLLPMKSAAEMPQRLQTQGMVCLRFGRSPRFFTTQFNSETHQIFDSSGPRYWKNSSQPLMTSRDGSHLPSQKLLLRIWAKNLGRIASSCT